MRSWLLFLVTACSGSAPKPPPQQPELPPPERTIDCKKLTDHVIEAQLVGSADTRDDVAARRAKMLADCPAHWHADHPSELELQHADCMMAAKTAPDINECIGLPRYEAILKTPKTGIPECDEYAEKTESLLHCQQIAQATRDQLRDTFVANTGNWTSIPDAAKPKLAQDCKVGISALDQIAASMKCSP